MQIISSKLDYITANPVVDIIRLESMISLQMELQFCLEVFVFFSSPYGNTCYGYWKELFLIYLNNLLRKHILEVDKLI